MKNERWKYLLAAALLKCMLSMLVAHRVSVWGRLDSFSFLSKSQKNLKEKKRLLKSGELTLMSFSKLHPAKTDHFRTNCSGNALNWERVHSTFYWRDKESAFIPTLYRLPSDLAVEDLEKNMLWVTRYKLNSIVIQDTWGVHSKMKLSLLH